MSRNYKIYAIAAVLCFMTTSMYSQDTEVKKNKRIVDKKAVNTKKSTPTKIIERLPGSWQIYEVYQGNKEVTAPDQGTNEVITFNREGRYVRYAGSNKIDSGAYRVNEQQNRLYLESINGGPASEWKVNFSQNNTMTLRKHDDSQHAESFRYVYTRRDQGDRRSN